MFKNLTVTWNVEQKRMNTQKIANTFSKESNASRQR